ncbi:4-hydroxy-3-methylbut-2-enyl diphosphate reductase [Bacillus anthracis]|uniref:4-hydroxy-3-methylbut-2-enyl diphosphate reductase n=1 Tax=Bacillus anthracis TaxID=1392 RepID=UPI00099B886E|nr:4-hydroxy-3-methylbut-2-enyl diphosphate reductase [Bacillus anthracis]OPD54059.1 4-hydroxy-3-methylbut-2-enyl diphosphate reductase [Bacillus anthracis]
MKVIKISPRGYCYGVVDALILARNANLDKTLPRPIYILGMIVHNKHITKALEEEGVITLEGPDYMKILDQIDYGTVIFTAHGVSPKIKNTARTKGLTTIDATCPEVQQKHDFIKKKIEIGYYVIYIGKKGNPESKGVVGIAPDRIYLIEKAKELETIAVPTNKILVTNQTTMSQWDVQELMEKIKMKFPTAEFYKEICLATQVRQEAVVNQAVVADLTIVVGDPKSNNSNRLAQVSEERANTKAYRIADVSEIQLEWLQNIESVAVTSGASTPTPITKEVITFLEQYNPFDPITWKRKQSIPTEKILPHIKRK